MHQIKQGGRVDQLLNVEPGQLLSGKWAASPRLQKGPQSAFFVKAGGKPAAHLKMLASAAEFGQLSSNKHFAREFGFALIFAFLRAQVDYSAASCSLRA
ncbi:hypothetical protein [Extensimonas perlucida]|uniref:hypothetical protein n=1 Tax=Extensimonas perlucida TaxID=2590786 RepID=UPI00119CBE03|nr:hypothetical protein [Extensimonas perlucida]